MREPTRNVGVRPLRWRAGALAVAGIVAATGGMLAPANGGASSTSTSSSSASSQRAELGFQVQLGPEQRLIGPSREIDVPYFSERDASGRLFGVAGTSRTKVWRTANNTRLSHPRLILNRGGAGKFDECGVWLMSIQKITAQRWIGFYHAESKGSADDCDHVADTTVWRMGLAQTTNGGRTWTRPNYPNNVILTGTNSTATNGSRHAGNGRVVKLGSRYYMFYQSAHGDHPEQPGVYVARANVSDRGTQWKKYYCHPATLTTPAYCAFDEPGIGGKATPITRISEKARYVNWNGYLQRWIGLDASGRIGFRLFASEQASGGLDNEDVLMDWTGSQDIYPPVSSPDDTRVDQWGGHTRDRRSRQLYAYPSVLGARGDSWRSGQTFFIYYMKLFPGEKFDERYLFRRKVTLKKVTGHALNRVELTTYKDRKTGKRRTTTEAPKAKTFRRIGPTGYLLSHPQAGWKQVFECARRGDFAMHVAQCKRGWTPYRRIGWIRPQRNGVASVPVFRCYDRQKNSHFAATRRGCAGEKLEGRLGFALRGLRL